MKVLIVEDDAMQRLAAVEVLSAAGYLVDDVDSADAAVSVIEAGWHGRVVVRRAYAWVNERLPIGKYDLRALAADRRGDCVRCAATEAG